MLEERVVKIVLVTQRSGLDLSSSILKVSVESVSTNSRLKEQATDQQHREKKFGFLSLRGMGLSTA